MKYHKLTENAEKPQGFWGRLMIRSMNKGHSDLTDWALGYIKFENGMRVLDVGCGGGRTVSKLCGMVGSGKVYGIDYSALCVNKSIKYNHKNVLCGKAEITKASVSELPFPGGSFDLVTAVETYYFWPDKLHDLTEIRRVLRSGGKLLLVFEMLKSEENPDRWKAVEERLNIKAVSSGEINEMLLRAGYRNIRLHVRQNEGRLCAIAEKE